MTHDICAFIAVPVAHLDGGTHHVQTIVRHLLDYGTAKVTAIVQILLTILIREFGRIKRPVIAVGVGIENARTRWDYGAMLKAAASRVTCICPGASGAVGGGNPNGTASVGAVFGQRVGPGGGIVHVIFVVVVLKIGCP